MAAWMDPSRAVPSPEVGAAFGLGGLTIGGRPFQPAPYGTQRDGSEPGCPQPGGHRAA